MCGILEGPTVQICGSFVLLTSELCQHGITLAPHCHHGNMGMVTWSAPSPLFFFSLALFCWQCIGFKLGNDEVSMSLTPTCFEGVRMAPIKCLIPTWPWIPPWRYWIGKLHCFILYNYRARLPEGGRAFKNFSVQVHDCTKQQQQQQQHEDNDESNHTIIFNTVENVWLDYEPINGKATYGICQEILLFCTNIPSFDDLIVIPSNNASLIVPPVKWPLPIEILTHKTSIEQAEVITTKLP